jgi:hypothetical protein
VVSVGWEGGQTKAFTPVSVRPINQLLDLIVPSSNVVMRTFVDGEPEQTQAAALAHDAAGAGASACSPQSVMSMMIVPWVSGAPRSCRPSPSTEVLLIN